MGYQPWYQKQTYPAWNIPLYVEGNPDNITGLLASAFTMTFRNTGVNPPVDTTGTGFFVINTVNPAAVYYQPSASDVAASMNGQIIVSATFPNGTLAVYDPLPFVITAI